MRKIFLALVVAGCHTTSQNLPTSRISADLGVLVTGPGSVSAGATFYNGPAADLLYVELNDGDSISVNGHELQPKIILGFVSYGADITGGDAEGTQYTFALQRPDGGDALGSSCTIPPPLTVTAPASASRASDLTITWTPSGSGDEMEYTIDPTSTCVQKAGGVLTGDPGTLTIPSGTLQAKTAGATCTVPITISRVRKGTLDPAFNGGSVGCSQARAVSVQSSP